jgi:iron complex outermembrane receptor protein
VPGARIAGGIPMRGTIYDTQGNYPDTVPHSNNWGLSARYTHSFDWAKLSFLSAYRDNNNTYTADQDTTARNLSQYNQTVLTQTYQEELNLVGSTSKIDWTAGLFYFDAHNKGIAELMGGAPAANTTTVGTMNTASYAGYGQATLRATDTTRITAGIRYTDDQRTLNSSQVAAPGNTKILGTLLATQTGHVSFPVPTWRFAIDQHLAEDVMVYASYDRGFKSGVYNLSVTGQPPVKPERLDAYEVGTKSEWFDRLVQVNAAMFYYNYKDIQLTQFNGPVSELLNAAKGQVKGLDTEVIVAPPVATGRLTLNTGLSVLNAKYSSFPNGPFSIPKIAGGNIIVSHDLTGDDMIRAPKWTLAVGSDYKVPVGKDSLNFNLTYFHSDGFFWEADNRLRQPSYDILNAEIGLSFGSRQQYQVRIFGKNLGDTRYFSLQASNSLGDVAAPAAPRTYGVGFDFRL